MRNEYLESGKIINTHGVKGQIKLCSYCDTPRVLASLHRIYIMEGGVFVMHKVTSASVFKDFVIMSLENLTSCEEAQKLKETVVYAKRNDLPIKDGEAFIADIIGLDVIDADTGKVYGKITDAQKSPASYIYEIKTENGSVLFPAVKEFIVKTDIEKGVYVRPISGMFDELEDDDDL